MSSSRIVDFTDDGEMKEVESMNGGARGKDIEMTKVDPSAPFQPPMFQGNQFHPDFMYCGFCATCNDEKDEEKESSSKDKKGGKLTSISLPKRDEDDDEGSSILRSKVTVDNLECPSQVLVIQSILQPLQGVSRVLVKLEERLVCIDHDASTNQETFLSTLSQMGYFARSVSKPTDNNDIQLVKSQFYVKDICCASECPAVTRIIRDLEGTTKVQINITTKMVYVQHDANQLDANEIQMALHSQGFETSVYKDGAANAAHPSTNVGRTTLHMEKVLKKSDIQPLQDMLGKLTGVKRIGVNVAEGVVYIEHDVQQISADRLHTALLAVDYENTVASDAAEEILDRTTKSISARSKFVESTLLMPSLSLGHIRLLEKTFRQNYIPAQLRAFYPHVPSKTIKVEHNPNLLEAQAICTLMERFGMDAIVAVDGGVENLALPLLEDYKTPLYGGMGITDRNTLHINAILSGIFWFISILSYIGGNWVYLEYVGLLSVVFGIPPVAAKAWRTMKRCQIDANIMMVVASLGAIALQEYDEAASVAFLFAVSEYLEAKATRKARRALGAIVTLRPDHANVIHPVKRDVIIVPADKVPVGSLISVRTGDKICSDGVVVEGTSSVDESSLTGEAIPIVKRPDDTVKGGSINIGDSPIIIKTTCSADDSTVSRLIRLVEEAQSNRSPTEKLVDSFAKQYTPIVVLMAGLMCTVPWFFGREIGHHWTLNGLIIIVIACPCALTISTPVTYAAGLAATAQRGVIVKGGANLEALGSVEKVVFDKTGTLTKGKFILNNIETVGDSLTRKEMLGLLALIESPSSHPLSATLVQAARSEGAPIPRQLEMKDHTVLKGEGVTANIDGKKVYVGNRRLFQRLGMYEKLTPSKKLQTEEWSNNGGTVGFLGVEGAGIVGAFSVTDEIRQEASEVVHHLTEGGIEVMMLTGDSDGAARAVAKQVGLPDSAVHSQLLPEDKLHYVGSLITPPPKRCTTCRHKSLVLMVGDGINDAPALAVADVGVAMGEGASLAMEMSDITLMDSNLTKLLYTIQMGTRVIVTIQENIMLSLVAKLLVVGLTFAGKMTLLSAIASDVGIMLIVTLNGMKLLPSQDEKLTPAKKRRVGLSRKQYNEVATVNGNSVQHSQGIPVAEIV